MKVAVSSLNVSLWRWIGVTLRVQEETSMKRKNYPTCSDIEIDIHSVSVTVGDLAKSSRYTYLEV